MTSDDADGAEAAKPREEGAEQTRPGEKGPPAWKERHTQGGQIPDEPPDSSSETAQEMRVYRDPDEDDASSEE